MAKKTIFAISDIHLEFGVDIQSLLAKWPITNILVLAGDIGNANTNAELEKIRECLFKAKEKYSEVVFIAGNHEFYNCNYNRTKVIDNLRQIATETKTHFLHRETKVIEGIEFIGATLWSLIEKNAFPYLNDFKKDVFRSHIDYIGEFIDDFRFLQKTLQTRAEHPRIVITHHLPTTRLTHRRFEGHPASSGFYTNIFDQLNTRGVLYWFCGHTHEYGKCRYADMYCIANPLGYPKEHRETEVLYNVYSVQIDIS